MMKKLLATSLLATALLPGIGVAGVEGMGFDAWKSSFHMGGAENQGYTVEPTWSGVSGLKLYASGKATK